MDEGLEVRILGPVGALVDGRMVDIGPPLQRTLLAALAVDVGKAVSVDELTDRVWGEAAPSTARKSIQKYVSQLRRQLGSEVIARVGPGYRLELPPDQIDARSVESQLDELRDEEDPVVRLNRLDGALARFRGEPLAGIDTHFAVMEQARLRELRLAVAEQRAVAMLDAGQVETAIAWTTELMAEFPFQERLWEISIRALYSAGRQADALANYQRLRRHLGDELGIEPSPPLQALERLILAQDPVLTEDGSVCSDGEDGSGAIEERRTVSLVTARPPATSSTPQLDEVIGHLVRLAERHGGRQVEADHMAVAAFGMPSHEDDPLRAATTALELARMCDVHCSITTGEAVLLEEGGSLRMPGSVLERARAQLERSPLRKVVIDQPSSIALRRSGTVRSSSSGDLLLESVETGPDGDLAGVFIGRTRELKRIVDQWSECVEDQASQLVTLLGEGGLGKSRLLAEVAGRIGPDLPAWLQTTCQADSDGPFSPIVRLVRVAFGSQPTAQIHERLVRAEVSESEAAWLENHASRLFDGVSQPSADRAESLRAWARLLVVTLGPAGGVVALDDVHLASATLIEFVEEVLGQSMGPLLVVCSGRLEYVEESTTIRTDRPSTVVTLGPLDAEDSHRLVSALLRDGESAALSTSLADRSGGNPFFIHELTGVANDSDRTDFPGSVRAAVLARVDGVSRLARISLQTLSAIGEPAPLELISAALDLPVASVHQPLAELRRRRLVTTVIGEPGLFQVAHSLISEVASELVTSERRLRLHDRAGGWYRTSSGPSTLEMLERRAYHAEEAYRLAAELAPAELDRLARLAGQDLLALGLRLAGIDASKCQDVMETALSRIEAGTVDWAQAALEAGRAATDRGDWLRAEERLEQAIAVYRRHGNRRGEASSRIALDIKRQLRGEEAVGVETELALELVRDLPGPELAKALSRRLAIKAVSGDVEASISLGEEALGVIEAYGTAEDRARAMNAMVFARLELGDVNALTELQATLDLCIDEGLTRQATSAYNNLGNNTWVHTGPGNAIPILRRAIEFAALRGHEYMAEFSTSTLAEVYFDGGRWDEATATAESLMTGDPGGRSRAGHMAANIAGLIHLWQGRIGQAGRLLDAASIDRAREVGDLQQLAPWLVTGAMVATATGRHDRAAELLMEMGRSTAGNERWRCAVAHESVRVALAIDRIDLARELAVFETQPVVRAELSRLSALALLTSAEGATADALDLNRRARTGWESFGSPLEAGLLGLSEAQCLRTAGRSRDGDRRVEEAKNRLRSLGVDLNSTWWQLD